MPAERKDNACIPWIAPGNQDFTRPNWEVLDVSKHLPWIYEMVRILPPADKVLPTYETWREAYMARLTKGEIRPGLKRTRLELVKGRGPVTLLSYSGGDPVYQTCFDGEPTLSGGDTSERIFLFDASLPQPILEFSGFFVGGDIILYKRQPYIVSQTALGGGWYISILHPTTSQDASDALGLYAEHRCGIVDRVLKNNALRRRQK